MDKELTITIDGPAGAGKSTVGKLLARHLGYRYLDTGAIYRALALKADRLGIAEKGEEDFKGLVSTTVISFRRSGEELHVIVDGEDVTDKIRTPRIGMLASRISAFPIVREGLLSIQREIGKNGGIVADGRDMGTVVFPRAEIKFYLDADHSERSRRRFLELKEAKSGLGLSEVQKDIQERDKQDMERKAAPLKPAEGAVVIDSTGMGIDEVVKSMLAVIEAAGSRN